MKNNRNSINILNIEFININIHLYYTHLVTIDRKLVKYEFHLLISDTGT